ncbi:hypothetical protein J4463_00660 [Candidatus Pacearchaeota archaeon]|nr:hypothetical protein [Candidatus Pacearchaeota archaeon]
MEQEKNNTIMHRKEVILSINSNTIPSKQSVIDKLSEKYKAEKEGIVIEKIKSNFGSKEFIITAKVYEKPEYAVKYEVITRKERKKMQEEAKKSQAGEK